MIPSLDITAFGFILAQNLYLKRRLVADQERMVLP